MATYAIGDIHGNSESLINLLSQIDPGTSDEVVFLGDYIDGGSNSKTVIDLLIEFEKTTTANVIFLKGNHEEWLHRTLEDYSKSSWIIGMSGLNTIRSYSKKAAETLEKFLAEFGESIFIEPTRLPLEKFCESIPESHQSFFKQLRTFYRSSYVVCSHAGVSAKCTRIETEPERVLLWGENNWWDGYSGSDRIVYGHWQNAIASENSVAPNVLGNTFGIDASQVEELIAIRFPDLEFWTS